MNIYVSYVLELKTNRQKFPSARGFLAMDTVTFEGVSGTKISVGFFYVWNLVLVFKSKVKLWSWSWKKKIAKKSLRNKTKFHEYH